ncbi:hypothetical protein GIB67_026933 [Kingdonia uniflora]|uniref:Uncharacterized protein n=1 Tax=Kingdonia uniflora TaxID=39325 RepID=A0A7J7P235_9MAGN|nr:hypothetical protein GIB67_026933 [Kingdonia uniflora]
MSFITARLAAGKEGAYFLQESKLAVTRLAQKQNHLNPSSSKTTSPVLVDEPQPGPDVLPEILKHSLPSKIFEPPCDSSLSITSKWALPHDPNKKVSASADALNPLRAYLSLPQVTFGAKRWKIANAENVFNASTANDLRQDKYTYVNPEKFKAAAEGLTHIGKSFAIATAIVFGGSTFLFGWTASKLEVHNTGELRDKGRTLLQPQIEMFREQLIPLKIWAENTSRKWHMEKNEDVKENTLVKEISKMFGPKKAN